MKFKDYIRLGKISVKSRKKSTRNTAFGLSFALIILIPIIFFTLAFTLDLNEKINEKKSISTFNIATVDNIEGSSGSRENNAISRRDINQILDSEGIEEVNIYDTLYFEYMNYNSKDPSILSVDIDGRKLSYKKEDLTIGDYFSFQNKIKVLNNDSNPIASSHFYDLENNGVNTFTGTGFKGDGKGQIIISEYLLESKNLKPEQVIGKKFTLYATLSRSGNIYLDDDNNPNNSFDPFDSSILEREITILKDFEIVGVIASEYYQMNYTMQQEPHMIINYSSLYEEDDIKYKPILTEIENPFEKNNNNNQEKYYVATYPEDIDKILDKANEEKFLPVIMPAVKYANWHSSETIIKNYQVVCKDFKSASKIDDKINAAWSNVTGTSASYNPFAVSEFTTFKSFSTMGIYMALGLSIFGGIILLATLLNLYNTINYSVESRHNFIGMMRAIGQKNISIVKSYIVEILLIFKKSLLWILIFSAALSFLLKFSIDSAFTNYNDSPLPIIISLNFNYYFITLGIVLVFTIIVALLFSFVCCRPVIKKSILDVLVEDK